MKCACETCATRASAATSSGCVYARSIASRARSSLRFCSSAALLTLAAQRRALEGLGQQHLLREDEVRAVVVRHLVVVAHRDRVERARDLAVAAEDAAREVDLVDGGVALPGRHAVLRRVLRGHDTDAVRGTRRGAQRAADALLEPSVLE